MATYIKAVCSIVISVIEAQAILAAFGPSGVRYSDLFKQARELARLLRKEHYFSGEGGKWSSARWQKTDFIIQENPGSIGDRISDLHWDEQRPVTAIWWLVNICQQMEAMGLQFCRPQEAEPQVDYVPPVVAEPAVVVVETVPEPKPHAELSEVQKWAERMQQQKGWKAGALKADPPEKVQAAESTVAHEIDVTKFLPTRKTRLLRLRQAEVEPLYRSITSWFDGVHLNEVKEKLGSELATVLKDNHFLVKTKVVGQMVVNALMFAAVDIVISSKNPRIVAAAVSPLCNKGIKERLSVLVKQLAPVIQSRADQPVSAPLATAIPEVEPKKPAPPEHPVIRLIIEEVQALRAVISKDVETVLLEDMRATLGQNLFDVLRTEGYIVDRNGGYVALDQSRFAITILNTRRDTNMPVFRMERWGFVPPSPETTLDQRLHQLRREMVKTANRQLIKSGAVEVVSWALYLKVGEARVLVQEAEEWQKGVTWSKVQETFGEEFANQLREKNFLLQTVQQNELWRLNEPLLVETAVHVKADPRLRITGSGAKFDVTNKIWCDRLKSLIAGFEKANSRAPRLAA